MPGTYGLIRERRMYVGWNSEKKEAIYRMEWFDKDEGCWKEGRAPRPNIPERTSSSSQYTHKSYGETRYANGETTYSSSGYPHYYRPFDNIDRQKYPETWMTLVMMFYSDSWYKDTKLITWWEMERKKRELAEAEGKDKDRGAEGEEVGKEIVAEEPKVYNYYGDEC